LLGSFVPLKQWKPGNELPHNPPFDVNDVVSIDFSTLSPTDVYKFLVSSVIPRPIALVSTVPEKGGCINLAPISYFSAVCSNPPLLMISITPNTKGELKDTLVNIKKTGGFVINSVSEWQVEPMNASGAPYPYGVSEMEKVGFHPLPSTLVCQSINQSINQSTNQALTTCDD
jgi:flavin reductase (DIM6/NTAB) family NADH-FMN oxidoreductase RutF